MGLPDAIILAAGENVRLQSSGLAPGRKPLILRDGEVLIRRLCRQIEPQVGDIIIVCSPSNVQDIVFATRSFAPMYVVQPEPQGPQNALDIGLRATNASEIILLMGDNFVDVMPAIRPQTVCVVENEDEALHPLRAGVFSGDDTQGKCLRWLGPIRFPRVWWTANVDSWVVGFRGHVFDYDFKIKVKDLGTL